MEHRRQRKREKETEKQRVQAARENARMRLIHERKKRAEKAEMDRDFQDLLFTQCVAWRRDPARVAVGVTPRSGRTPRTGSKAPRAAPPRDGRQRQQLTVADLVAGVVNI